MTVRAWRGGPDEDPPPKGVCARYTVREGDRLSAIAGAHGVDAVTIRRLNPAKKTRLLSSGEVVFASLQAGETLAVPMPAHANCPAAYTYADGMCTAADGTTQSYPSCDAGFTWDPMTSSCIVPTCGVNAHPDASSIDGCSCNEGFGAFLSDDGTLSCLGPADACAWMKGTFDASTGLCRGPFCGGHGTKSFANDPSGMGCSCDDGYEADSTTGEDCVPVASTSSPSTQAATPMAFYAIAGAVILGAGAVGIYLARKHPEGRRSNPNVREMIREREKAKKYWDKLSREDRFELGDQFVLGDFDWRDWFHEKPSKTFLDELDNLRIQWEQMTS